MYCMLWSNCQKPVFQGCAMSSCVTQCLDSLRNANVSCTCNVQVLVLARSQILEANNKHVQSCAESDSWILNLTRNDKNKTTKPVQTLKSPPPPYGRGLIRLVQAGKNHAKQSPKQWIIFAMLYHSLYTCILTKNALIFILYKVSGRFKFK